MIGTSARVRALLIAAGALLAAADFASAQAPVPNTPRVEAIRKSGALRVGVLANPPWLTENTRNPQQPWGGQPAYRDERYRSRDDDDYRYKKKKRDSIFDIFD